LQDIYLRTAETAARNSDHMHNLASEQKRFIDDADPFGDGKSILAVKSFLALTRAGNEAMVIPSTLLKTSQDMMKEAPETEDGPTLRIIGGLPD
jgi:hypothetical protein